MVESFHTKFVGFSQVFLCRFIHEFSFEHVFKLSLRSCCPFSVQFSIIM